MNERKVTSLEQDFVCETAITRQDLKEYRRRLYAHKESGRRLDSEVCCCYLYVKSINSKLTVIHLICYSIVFVTHPAVTWKNHMMPTRLHIAIS